MQAVLFALFLVVGDKFLEAEEIAASFLLAGGPVKGVALPADVLVTAQLLRPDGRIRAWIDRRGVQSAPLAVSVPPADRIGHVAPRRHAITAAVVQLILEHVAGVVENDVEDHVDAALMGRIDQRPRSSRSTSVGSRCATGSDAKSRIDGDEILDAVAVVAFLILAVFLHR